MLDSFGFSVIGLLFIAMLTIPNLIWTHNQPKNYDPQNESKVFLMFERVGQVLVTTCAVFTTSFNIKEINVWTLWLAIAFGLMFLYELWWIRYFRSEKTLKNFYSSFLGIPVAGATLPVLAFFFLGIFGRSLMMVISIIILGIGHIGIHLEHKKNSNE